MVIKAVRNVDPKILEEEVLSVRKEIFQLKQAYADLNFRTQQNQLDTARCAAQMSGIETILYLLQSKKGGSKEVARALLEETI